MSTLKDKRNPIAKAVKFALLAAASVSALSAPSVFAAEAEEEEAKEQKIVVTGSRIKRTDVEGASPVITISTEDMAVEGNFTVADALRNSSLNSFGSFSESSGSSWQSQATIDLRGAGANRTLVLMDGRRLAPSPTMGGAVVNLNAIPFSAVERVEILTDGASSTYGSDAVAGVVNLIMKKDFEGLEVHYGIGQRDRDSGTTSREFSLVSGVSSDKGNITFAFDHQDRLGISDGARDFTAAKMTDFDGDGTIQAYTETDGWSIFGATVAAPDWSSTQSSTQCDSLIAQYGSDTFQRVAADDDWGPGSEYCMYAYANVSYNKASIDRNTVYVDSAYEISSDVEWFGRAMFVHNKSFGRYAPPAAWWNNMGYDNPENPYGVSGDGLGFADPNNSATAWSPQFTDANDVLQYYSYDAQGDALFNDLDASGDFTTGDTYIPGVYDPTYAYQTTEGLYRWVGIGTRDGFSDDYTQDYTMGFRGDTDNGSWEVYYHKSQVDNKQVGKYYLSYGGLAYNVANGIDLGSEEGIANLKATTLQESLLDFDQVYAGYGFDAGELGGGVIAHYVGAEYVEQSYADIFDGQSATGLIGGSAGNSAAGAREMAAVFYETVLPVTDDVEVNLAVRYDDYSDFGDNVAPKASVRWQAMDGLVVRASYSEAFRAPSLSEMHAATTFSAESAIDYAQGSTTPKQYTTYFKSNPDLGAETSEYINFGVAYDITDEVAIKVDYFNLSIDNVIQTKSVQGLLTDEANGLLTSVLPGTDVSNETFYLIRAANGVLLEAGSGNNNGIGFDIEGIDISFQGRFDLGVGQLGLNWINSFILAYDQEIGGVMTDTSGWAGQPDFKSTATISWTMDSHSVAWNTNFIASTFENQPGTPNPVGSLDSWLIHNLSYSYQTDGYGKILFGINNVTDEDPVLNSAGQYTDPGLYNNFGRDYRLSYTISF